MVLLFFLFSPSFSKKPPFQASYITVSPLLNVINDCGFCHANSEAEKAVATVEVDSCE